MKKIENLYQVAREYYAEIGVDTEIALKHLKNVHISSHCWQGDDLSGFEIGGSIADSVISPAEKYPGKPRNADELRADLQKALSLIPGRHRVSLHAIYAETDGKRVERNRVSPAHFRRWVDWAKEKSIILDFNPTFFSHPLAASGFTLASRDPGIRDFWVEHGIACRKIGEYFGKNQSSPCITNIWVPDGYKDTPVDRKKPREILWESLNLIFSEKIDPGHNRDALESKLFGIGTESYIVGSYDLYLGYTIQHDKILCLDMGHFHPTESIADKVSSLLMSLNEISIHLSRGVRWDSGHIVILNEDVRNLAQEIVRGNYLTRVNIELDYLDPGISRIAGWVVGMRSMQKALLLALLEPYDQLCSYEARGDYTGRLVNLELMNNMPWSFVWDYFCLTSSVPTDDCWIEEMQTYEKNIIANRA